MVNGAAVGQDAAAKGLHGHKAHVGRQAIVFQLELRLAGKIGKGELQQVIQAALDGLARHMLAVVGDADVQQLALFFGAQHRIVNAVLPAGLGTERRIVYLKHVDMVGLHEPQTGVKVL